MKKLTAAEGAALNGAMPANQNIGAGSRMAEVDTYGLFHIDTLCPAGAVGLVTPVALGEGDLLFDFEVMDIIVRTETSVASSTVYLQQGANAVSNAIISATANNIARAGILDKTYTKFYPQSNPAGYAAAPARLVDAGGATAAARTVTLVVRKI